jgi:hypothetical protein
MKALAYLFASQALDAANASVPTGRRLPEPDLPPIATTPETARAWREWARSTSPYPPAAAPPAAPATAPSVLPLRTPGIAR